MQQFANKLTRNRLVWLVNGLLFMFFVTILNLPKGYNLAPLALAVISIIYLCIYYFKFKEKLKPSKDDKLLIFSFLFYFATFLLSLIIHGNGAREIDTPSRILLFLPLLLLFKKFPIKLNTILYGIPIGTALSGMFAIYHKFVLHLEKPFPYLMHIQAGDIAISFATMSLAIAIYWAIQKNYIWLILSLIAAGLGILASALTGARGGWVGLPIILAIILWFSYKNLSKKLISIISTGLLIILTLAVFIPQTNVLNRIHIAHNEVVDYFAKGENTSSVGARFDMWQSAFLGIAEKPILGWGKKGYIELKKEQLKEGLIAENTTFFNDAHNQYIDTTVKRGVIGLIGLILCIAVPLYLFLKRFRENQIVSLLGIIHIVSAVLFFTSQSFLGHLSGTMFYFFLIIVLYSQMDKQNIQS